MRFLLFAAFLAAAACATDAPAPAGGQSKFQQDRTAILAMQGDFNVDFDFRETASLSPGYRIAKPTHSGGYEVIRTIADTGTFISLQHVIVAEQGGEKFAIKHWRQDWQYEPTRVTTFIGGNAWSSRPVSASERAGKWSQQVYEVEDAPRYGAVGAWTHDNGVSQWTSSAEWRPLPRREATKRSDYDAILAVNRHTITPTGWVQEEDNSKLILRNDKPVTLAREVGVNTYTRFNAFDVKVATDYWSATKDFWADIRADWSKLEATAPSFAVKLRGEPEQLYMPILDLADEVQEGKKTRAAALAEARKVMAKYVTTDVGALKDRIGPTPETPAKAAPAQ